MSLIVRKYGGSSVSNIDKIKKIAQSVKKLYTAGNHVVLVVSAMGETTNTLLRSAYEISENPDLRELDMLLSIGERKSISLMALALNAIDVPSISYTGSQIGIITDNNHGNARILEIKPFRLQQALQENKVVVVAGYQGVSLNKEITTLGRGGTDTTAIALSSALGADACQLMKDVEGLMTLPPKYFHKSQLRKEVSLQEMYHIAAAGMELVALPAIRYALENSLEFQLCSAQTDEIGTRVILSPKNPVDIPLQLCVVDCEKSNSEDSANLKIQIKEQEYLLHFNSDKLEKPYKLFSLFNINQNKIDYFIENLRPIKPLFIHFESKKLQFLIKSDLFEKEQHYLSALFENNY